MAKEWFQHDYGTRNKKKLAALIQEEGSRGYGLFWIIVEMLYEDSTKKMELDEYTYVAIKKESGDDIDYIKLFIQKCIDTYKVFKKFGKNNFSTSRVKENAKFRKEISKINSANGIKSGESRRNKSTKMNGPFKTVERNRTKSNTGEEKRVEESKEEIESTTVLKQEVVPAPDLSKSNLFRKPNIPTMDQVWEAFSASGGTREMARSFWDKHSATGWFIDGSPIINHIPLAQKFIDTWKRNESEKSKQGATTSGGPKLEILT